MKDQNGRPQDRHGRPRRPGGGSGGPQGIDRGDASQPSSGADGNRINELGDIVLSAFLTPSKSGRVILGVGPVVLLPAATNDALGTEKFGMGPTAVVLTQPGHWTFGLLANQIWSMSGANDREGVNRTYLQPFMHYNLGGGLSVSRDSQRGDHQ